MLDNWQLAELPQFGVVSSIPAGSTMIYRFLCRLICVFLCQSIKIKPANMYIAIARAQFKINTHRCCNRHLCIPDGRVISCPVQPRAWHWDCVYRHNFSGIYSERAGQLTAGGVASVWRSWLRSPPGPRLFIGSLWVYMRFKYDIKQIPGHDTAISQIYGSQNWIHEPTYQINALRNQIHNAISIKLLNST